MFDSIVGNIDIRPYVVAMLREGSHVWMLDGCGCFQTICRSFSGSLITFDQKPLVNLNPFGHVRDLAIQMPFLSALFTMIVSPTLGNHSQERLVLEHAIETIWHAHQQQTTIDDLVDYFKGPCHSTDRTIHQMWASALSPYGQHGQYGAYFSAQPKIVPNNLLTVFDLSTLVNNPSLEYLIVGLLMAQFALMGPNVQQRVCFIDEKWAYGQQYHLNHFIRCIDHSLNQYHSILVSTPSSQPCQHYPSFFLSRPSTKNFNHPTCYAIG